MEKNSKKIVWAKRDVDHFGYHGEIAIAYITPTNGHFRVTILAPFVFDKDKKYSYWHNTLEEAMSEVEEIFLKEDDEDEG